ncbi:uncharacterized protein LOC6646438 [Drosophila willistoni]|uniref:uncharacterized protein LOC6646438 n=1 Tax=Drosophila willistoni TaxID=7260 RepID=UPI001F083A91|nr:uncharacterized protein LOC6646438 [Drosophila willistoni]
MWKLLGICLIIGIIDAHVTFTNLKCNNLDKNFSDIKTCRIKAVNRTHKYIDIYVKMMQLPIDNVTINFKLMRFDGHGYKPHFFDLTYDACKFLRSQNSNPIIKAFYETYRQSSNLNHTCPYNHDLIVDKLWTGNLDAGFLAYLPSFSGDFAAYTSWYAYNLLRVTINFYLKITY